MTTRPLLQATNKELLSLLQSLPKSDAVSREEAYRINRIAAALGLPELGKPAKQPIDALTTRLECETNFSVFAQHAVVAIEPGTSFMWNWHIDAVCNHLDAMFMGVLENLIINMPPGCMKAASYDTPVWTTEGWKPHGELSVGDYVLVPTAGLNESSQERRTCSNRALK